MREYQELKTSLLDLFKRTILIVDKLQDKATLEYLKSSATRLHSEKLLAIVCGEFKQGKSSLINAILNESELFPVDVDITTNLVSTISYGESEEITVYVGKQGKEQSLNIKRNQIADYVTESRNKNNNREARLLSIESPNNTLESGLVLVDTPGVGGMNSTHTDITYAFIPNADVVLFVSDAFSPLKTPELDFVKRISQHCENIIFVITKIDTAEDYKVIETNNRKKLAKVLDISEDSINIISVSSRTKLAYIQTHDDEDLEDSHFPELEDELWKLLNENRGYTLLMAALGHLRNALANIIRPLRVEWQAYQKKTEEELNSLETKLSEAQNRLRQLLDKKSAWQIQLSDGISDIQKNLSEKFQDEFVDFRRQIEDYLEDSSMLENPEVILQQLEIEVDAVTASLSKELAFQAEMLQIAIEDSTKLSLNFLEADEFLTRTSPFSMGNATVQRTGIWNKTLDATRSGMFTGFAGATVGATIGAGVGFLFGGVGAYPGYVVGSALGAVLGKVAGFVTGARQSLSQVSAKDKALNQRTIARIVNRFIDDSYREVSRVLGNTTRKLERSMRDELLNRIQREKTSCESSLSALTQARQRSRAEVTKRVAELEKPLKQLGELSNQVEDLVLSAEKIRHSQ